MTPSDLIDLLTAVWLGFIGACVGSFLNVVAYRMPLGMSVIWRPSHCPKCSHPIRAYDNVPVLGWLWLKGRCRDCGEPISPRYAIVEFVMGLAFLLLAYRELFSGGANLPGGPITQFVGAMGNVWVPQWRLIGIYIYHGVLLSLLMSVVLMSLDAKQAPRRLVVFGIIVGVTSPFLWPHLHPPSVPTDSPLSTRMMSVVLVKGICILAGLGLAVFFWGRNFWSDQRPWDGHRRNLGCMLILACAFLCWQALLGLFMFALGIGAIWWLVGLASKRVPAPMGEASFMAASFLLLVFLRQWFKIMPW